MKRECNRLIPRGAYKVKKCAYCGKDLTSKDKTKDHVPPRFIFKNISDEILEKRITVPCCYQCNQEYSHIEQRLKPLFEHIYNRKADVKLIEEFNQNGDFNLLMTKIALGFRTQESSEIFLVSNKPTISYFYSKDVSISVIESFKKIRHGDYIEDISSNTKYPGLIITLDDFVIGNAPTDILSLFWHEYNVNNDYVRMSFYNTLYVQVQF